MTRVLLTGAKGFLGSALDMLLSADNTVELIRLARRKSQGFICCDLTDTVAVFNMLEQVNPDIIIHAAAFVPKTSDEYQSDLSEENLLMVENLLKSKNVKFVNISSMTVYGPSENIYRSEDGFLSPQSKYGKSKLDIERLLSSKNINSLSIRIPGLFGSERESGLIYNLLKTLSHDEVPELPSEPLLWSSMEVHDAALSIVKVVKAFELGEYRFSVINVGYRDILSINKLLDLCSEIYSVEVDYDVEHPEFAFCLKNLDSLNAVPEKSFRQALLQLKDDYGF